MIGFGRSFSRRQKTAARAFSALRCSRSCSIAPAGRRGRSVLLVHSLICGVLRALETKGSQIHDQCRVLYAVQNSAPPRGPSRVVSVVNYGVCFAVICVLGKGVSPASRAFFADGILCQRARNFGPLPRSTLGAQRTGLVR